MTVLRDVVNRRPSKLATLNQVGIPATVTTRSLSSQESSKQKILNFSMTFKRNKTFT